MKKDLKINIDYYEKNWKSLIDQYEKANPTYLHSLLLEYTNKEDLILELGFGSGRELNFLYKKGYKNLFGIDASLKFVEFVQERFSNKKNFIHSVLPKIDIEGKFDFIYSIALLMHLSPATYKELVENIDKKLAKSGKIFFSYSLGKREDKNRVFYEVDETLLERLFKEKEILKEKEFITTDSLNRDIKWKNIIYKRVG